MKPEPEVDPDPYGDSTLHTMFTTEGAALSAASATKFRVSPSDPLRSSNSQESLDLHRRKPVVNIPQCLIRAIDFIPQRFFR